MAHVPPWGRLCGLCRLSVNHSAPLLALVRCPDPRPQTSCRSCRDGQSGGAPPVFDGLEAPALTAPHSQQGTVHSDSALFPLSPSLSHINHFLRAPWMCQLILVHAFSKAGLGGVDAWEWSSAIPVLQWPPLGQGHVVRCLTTDELCVLGHRPDCSASVSSLQNGDAYSTCL